MHTLIPALGLLVIICLPIIFRVLSHPATTLPEYRQHQRVLPREITRCIVEAEDNLPPDVPVLVSYGSCRECGQTPMDIPIDQAVVSFQDTFSRNHYQVLASCWSCLSPLVSGIIDRTEAEALILKGAVDEYAELREWRNDLALLPDTP